LPTTEAGEKFCKRFNLNTYALVAQPLRRKRKLRVTHYEKLNSKIYVKEKILWQKAFSYGFLGFRSA